MAIADLIKVKDLKAAFQEALAKLERMDENKSIMLNARDRDDDTSEDQGFLCSLSIDIEPSMDEEQMDVLVDITWSEA